MSVVAAKVTDKEIVMAADSILVHGITKRDSNFDKMILINNMIIGSSGYAQETSILWDFANTHKPAAPTVQSMLDFMLEFAQWLGSYGLSPEIQNEYLIAYEGHLFEIESMFVHEISDFTAIGAGEDFALAALYLGHDPKEAVEVACKLCCVVSEPILEYRQTKN